MTASPVSVRPQRHCGVTAASRGSHVQCWTTIQTLCDIVLCLMYQPGTNEQCPECCSSICLVLPLYHASCTCMYIIRDADGGMTSLCGMWCLQTTTSAARATTARTCASTRTVATSVAARRARCWPATAGRVLVSAATKRYSKTEFCDVVYNNALDTVKICVRVARC